jgi:hypothetical protein
MTPPAQLLKKLCKILISFGSTFGKGGKDYFVKIYKEL